MLGKPKYKVGDKVKFTLTRMDEKTQEYEGEVYIVDAYGTFFNPYEVCYDIMVEDFGNGEPCLVKHIHEPGVSPI